MLQPHAFPANARVFVLALLTFASRGSFADAPITVPMTADHWRINANVTATFKADDHAPVGILDVNKGSVEAKDLVFADGTIEFDIFMPDHGILGLRLRARDRDNAEAVYFRPQKNCDTSSDCLQYMPLERGAFEWDLFPEYETAAPIQTLSWNHVRVEALGRHMRVFINSAVKPTLDVPHMEGGALSGALLFGGPAQYKNLVITPATPSKAMAQNAPAPHDGFLRHWQISTAAVLSTIHDAVLDAELGVQPPYAAMPPDGAAWHAVAAQAKGLVNFSREIGSNKDAAITSVAWAKTTLTSSKAQTKTAQMGFVREAWVYVNGVLVFSGRNIYGTPAGEVAGARISLDNGSFQLPLKQGKNEIVVALDDNLPGNVQHFGWGMEMKLKDPALRARRSHVR
jgi:hypothetical protein